VLQSYKVDIAQTREEILKELDPNHEAHKEGVPIRVESISKQSALPSDRVDISKRYDVYCAERSIPANSPCSNFPSMKWIISQ
jgi:hypothetical protein